MIHMLSRFDLKEGADFERFRQDYASFANEMRARGLIEGSGPLGRRHANTPMDTDEEWRQGYFAVMTFRDRDQLDAAYAHIETATPAESAAHRAVLTVLQNAVFTCWEDLP